MQINVHFILYLYAKLGVEHIEMKSSVVKNLQFGAIKSLQKKGVKRDDITIRVTPEKMENHVENMMEIWTSCLFMASAWVMNEFNASRIS